MVREAGEADPEGAHEADPLALCAPAEFVVILARAMVRKVPWLEMLYRWSQNRWGFEMPRTYVIARYAGTRPWMLASDDSVVNPVLTRFDVNDAPALFVADPFVMCVGGEWQLFFEVLRADTQLGVVALATSADGVVWSYQGIIVDEPFHLSYPFVFAWDSEVYMIPESLGTRSVRLYRAIAYPRQWEFVADLLAGEDFADSTVFRHGGRWWMFTETGARSETGERVGWHDVLRLFFADELKGPWTEHPMSPVVDGDSRVARMAGRVLEHEGRLVRFGQDCSSVYGRQVFAFEIVELSPHRYEERAITEQPVVGPGRDGWNAGGMHHIDAVFIDGAWVAYVDGWRWSRVPHPFLRRLLRAPGRGASAR